MIATKEDITLLAHLMRRAGFGASRDDLEALAEGGYEAAVEKLIDYEAQEAVDDYLLYRYHPITETPGGNVAPGQANWLYWMVNTERPLQEKMALFWHHVFATGNSKVDNCNHLLDQIQMFRDFGMGSYKELLVKLASDPAMIYWLDNNENHKVAPNENWGRELLELFSMGVGNYTETDVYECSRAFTGWTIGAKMPRYPWGRHQWLFEYRAEDHDETEKEFLGYRGNFYVEDIIDIVLQQPACATFVMRHLYNFFVEDEEQVPAWNIDPPKDPDAIRTLSKIFIENNFEMKPVLRALFNSDFFKEAMYKKVKNPVEVVVSTLRLTGDLTGPDPRLEALARNPGYMGQDIMDPPSVEGWHTGHEWINSGSLVKRVNFVADRVSNTDLPGVQKIVNRISTANGPTMSPTEFVEHCLDQMGPVPVTDRTREELLSQAELDGPVNWHEDYEGSSKRTGDMLALIGATREFQFG